MLPVLRRVWAIIRGWAAPQRWGVTITIATLVVNLALFSQMTHEHPVSDGYYTWLFARSIAFDQDIDFTNDYRICGDHWKHNEDRGGGHPDNPFYVGPSLFLVPAIEVARLVHHFGSNTEESVRVGCQGPIVRTAQQVGSLVGALFIWLAYRAARRFVDDYAAGLTVGLFAFGTTLLVYATFASSYSHVYDGACVAALLVLSFRAYEAPERPGRWALAGAALAACFLHRVTNAPLGIIPAAFGFFALRSDRKRLLQAALSCALAFGLLGVLPQLCIYKYLYGRMIGVAPQGPYFMHPAHTHVWLLLFSPKGLFFMAPVAWLAVAGAVLAFRSSPLRPHLVVLMSAFWIQLYLAAMPLDWDASSTIGARRLIPLYPILIVLTAIAVGRAAAWFAEDVARVRALVTLLALTPLVVLFSGITLFYDEPPNAYDFYPSQELSYGSGLNAFWRTMDRRIGALAVLPAQLVFTLRYGLPHEAFWPSTFLNWYMRDFASLKFRRPTLALGDKNLLAGMSGFAREEGGARMRGRRATVVFCAEWPYATDLVVTARSAVPTTVTVQRRGFFVVGAAQGTLHLDTTTSTTTIPIPPGTFDSGLEEIVFETDDPDAGVQVESVGLIDTKRYAPSSPFL